MKSQTDIYDLIRSTISNSIKQEVSRIKAIKAVEQIQLTHLSLYNNSNDFFKRLKDLLSQKEYDKLVDYYFQSKVALIREEVFEYSFHIYKVIELITTIWWNELSDIQRKKIETKVLEKLNWKDFNSESVGARLTAFTWDVKNLKLPHYDWNLFNIIRPLRHSYAHGGIAHLDSLNSGNEKDPKPVWFDSFTKGEKKFILNYGDACQKYCGAMIIRLTTSLEKKNSDE